MNTLYKGITNNAFTSIYSESNYFQCSNARFEEKDLGMCTLENEKLSMERNFYIKKTVIFIISNLFLSIKRKFPKSGRSL